MFDICENTYKVTSSVRSVSDNKCYPNWLLTSKTCIRVHRHTQKHWLWVCCNNFNGFVFIVIVTVNRPQRMTKSQRLFINGTCGRPLIPLNGSRRVNEIDVIGGLLMGWLYLMCLPLIQFSEDHKTNNTNLSIGNYSLCLCTDLARGPKSCHIYFDLSFNRVCRLVYSVSKWQPFSSGVPAIFVVEKNQNWSTFNTHKIWMIYRHNNVWQTD